MYVLQLARVCEAMSYEESKNNATFAGIHRA